MPCSTTTAAAGALAAALGNTALGNTALAALAVDVHRVGIGTSGRARNAIAKPDFRLGLGGQEEELVVVVVRVGHVVELCRVDRHDVDLLVLVVLAMLRLLLRHNVELVFPL